MEIIKKKDVFPNIKGIITYYFKKQLQQYYFEKIKIKQHCFP